jgi:NADH-quinone oxidoreductase subunit E
MVTETQKEDFDKIAARYPDSRSAVLPLLHLVQRKRGYVAPEDCETIAEFLRLQPAEVQSVASFYTMLSREPVGQHTIWVCTNISCMLNGAESVLEHIAHKLGIRPGETTPDKRFTLRVAECLGSCGTGPMMQIDETYYENLTPEKVDEILGEVGYR